MRRIVITGIGIVSPLGNQREETWRRVLAGENASMPISAFRAETWPTNLACEVKGFALNELQIQPDLARYLHRAGKFAAAAAAEAINDANILTKVSPERFGVALGANIGPLDPEELFELTTLSSIELNHYPLRQSLHEKTASPEILRNHPGTLAAVLSSQWNCLGPSCTVQTACASSGQALGQAFLEIKRGRADAMLVGGADSLQSQLLLSGFALIGALSTRNNDPSAASRPFDKERDGFVAGEGAAFLILEEREAALARGAQVYAEVSAYGETMSAYRITDLPPDGRGIVEAMESAVEHSGIRFDQVDYINAHGTSTEVNDRIEAVAIRKVFYDRGGKPAISSTKSETGHLISAAGALEFAFCALAIRDQKIPPTRNLFQTDCGDDLDFVAHHARAQRVEFAMSNSIGFGGSNSSIIVRRVCE